MSVMPSTPYRTPTASSSPLVRVGLLVLALFASGLVLTPPGAVAAPLNCRGSVIYVVQRPNSKSSSTHGTVFALATSTVSEGTGQVTEVTQMPNDTYPNALGVSSEGAGLWAVEQEGKTGSATVYGYDAETGVWSSYLASGGTPSGFVAGAVDPENGIYYYAEYSGGKATLYGFNTNTDTAISGEMGTFELPGGGTNGDITFDLNGDLYVLASDESTRGVGVIRSTSVPSETTTSQLPITTLSSVAEPHKLTYNGIAFDNLGHLYLEGESTGGTFGVVEVDPNNGEVLTEFVPYASGAQSGSAKDVDLGS